MGDARVKKIPRGFSETRSKGRVCLRWSTWPPILVGLILIPWIIVWTIATPAVWLNFIYGGGYLSPEPNSLFDALGFTFFWLFGFSLVCYFYFRKDEFVFGSKQFERILGCTWLYVHTCAPRNAFRQTRYRTKQIGSKKGASSVLVHYVVLAGLFEQAIILSCFGFAFAIWHKELRVYEMMINGSDLADYVRKGFQSWGVPEEIESDQPDAV